MASQCWTTSSPNGRHSIVQRCRKYTFKFAGVSLYESKHVSLVFVTVFNLISKYRETENWLSKIQWEPTSTKLWKKWEKMESLTLKFMEKLRTIWPRSRSKMSFQDHSQPWLKKLNIQNKHLIKICYTRPQTSSMDLKFQSNKICQPNTTQGQRISREPSTVVTLSTLD